jgi:hypothetical protein
MNTPNSVLEILYTLGARVKKIHKASECGKALIAIMEPALVGKDF